MPVGRKVAIGAGEETTYGTPVAFTEWYPVTPDAMMKPIVNSLETGRLAQSRSVNKADTAVGTKSVEVEFGGAFPVQGHGVLLKHLFGKVTTPAVADTAYTHTYEVNPLGTFFGLTINRQFDAYMETAAGCKIKSMAFSCKVNDFLRYKCSMVGKSYTPATITGTPATTLVAAHPYWTFVQGAFTYGGTTYALTGADWTIGNELFDSEDAAYQLGSVTKTQLRCGMFTCEGTLKRRLAADGTSSIQSKFYENADAKTYAAGVLTFTSTTKIGSTSVYSMTVTFDEMELDVPEVSAEAGVIMETIKFKCRFDGTNTPVGIVVIDALATPATATGTDLLTA
jgi:hypothetical protein